MPGAIGAEPVLARWSQQRGGDQRVVGSGCEQAVDINDRSVLDRDLFLFDQRVEQQTGLDLLERVVHHLALDIHVGSGLAKYVRIADNGA